KGADFSLTTGLSGQRDALLARPFEELDCWNPLTRSTTRDSLESLS
ncbi:MAG: pentapeptide repeat-containing protein, partial [Synechococcus sp.]